MKRISLVIAAFALLVPTAGVAQTTFVYRPELRTYVPVPPPAVAAPQAEATPAEVIKRHEAMARGHRLNPNTHGHASMAAHCERLIKQATERARKAS